jgi:hypothetical protein
MLLKIRSHVHKRALIPIINERSLKGLANITMHVMEYLLCYKLFQNETKKLFF